ncbi:Aspartyl-tRNA(Asn) amidotransferase subunit A @ Glutamyl-tRNA(Gln) amidotransferase subunit A [invertebrate metagenome]|uniref:glutaminyl-tRNA synthase (glutamine-hydrolyzing) n=1 Tax=invertebrate metagenome TaxID=1711999 RepID=A0A484H701_9ZZZZ
MVDLTLTDALNGLSRGDFTAVELTHAHLRAIEQRRFLNAFITETPELALDQAQASDARRRAGKVGAMEGLPIGIKDLFCTEGLLTTAASHILDGFRPSYESTVSAQLRAAGAIMLGKTNMDEFAMGSSNMTSHYGSVLNPWQRQDAPEIKLVPGGSSGGSAAAVAARLCLAAIGTDTGGSIRLPASFCGIVGLKPTYGRCSRWGIISFASSLDQAGPLTRTVRDSALMLGAMGGYDQKDSTSAPVPLQDFEAAITGDIRGLKVGIPCEGRPDGLNAEIVSLWEQGIRWLKAAGAEPVGVSLPHTRYALASYYIIAPAEASSNLARYDGVRFGLRKEGNGSIDDMYMKTRAAGFGQEVQRRVLIGTYVLSEGYYDAYYLKAQRVRTLIVRDFQQAFKTVDVILTPTTPTPAFSMGEQMDDPITMYLNDVFTVPASLAGLPCLSVPAGLSSIEGLPLGLQVIGRPFDEKTVLKVGGVLETAACFTKRPQLAVEETESHARRENRTMENGDRA